jgi:UDP-N-acetylmuramoyl-tripeptide--D-alanyl-D-alanine ligase
VKAAIDVLSDFQSKGRMVAVLGDMLELGDSEQDYHVKIGEYLQTKKIDALFTVGDLAVNYLKKFKGEFKGHFPDKTKLTSALKDYLRPGDTVLIKGSRRIALEDVSEMMKEIG